MTSASPVEVERLYRADYARFLRVAEAVCGDVNRARDAVQEGFAAAICHRTDFRGEGRLSSWVWTCVINAARQAQRRDLGAQQLAVLDWSATSGDGVLDSEQPLRALVRTVLRDLPERQRLVLFLRYYADLDYRAIADVLGIRPGTVAATLNRAHSTIRQQLQEVPT